MWRLQGAVPARSLGNTSPLGLTGCDVRTPAASIPTAAGWIQFGKVAVDENAVQCRQADPTPDHQTDDRDRQNGGDQQQDCVASLHYRHSRAGCRTYNRSTRRRQNPGSSPPAAAVGCWQEAPWTLRDSNDTPDPPCSYCSMQWQRVSSSVHSGWQEHSSRLRFAK